MNREVQVRFWEGVGLRCPALLDYMHAYNTVSEARSSLARYIDFFNTRRPHTAHDRRTPDAVYFDAMPVAAAA